MFSLEFDGNMVSLMLADVGSVAAGHNGAITKDCRGVNRALAAQQEERVL
jgi:hypothetical protein